MLRLLALTSCLAVAAPHLHAQQLQTVPDSALIILQQNRIGLVGTKAFRSAQKFIVPTAILYLSVDGVPRANVLGARATASASYEYRVLGMRKQFAEDLARLVQDDLVARLRAIQITTLLFDDVKASASVAALERLAPDPGFGAPIEKTGSPRTTYAVVAPTDSQLFAGGGLKKQQTFKNLAREAGAIVLVPELWFQAPQSRQEHPTATTSRVTLTTGMDLVQASLTFIAPDGTTGSISHLIAIPDLSQAVGTMVEVVTDSQRPDSALVAGAVIGTKQPLKVSSGSGVRYWNLIVAETDYTAAVLRGAKSFFSAVGGIIERERRE